LFFNKLIKLSAQRAFLFNQNRKTPTLFSLAQRRAERNNEGKEETKTRGRGGI
jgi:hypothetical protein